MEPTRETLLLESFANTVDIEEGTDLLDTLHGLRDWLASHGLPAEARDADLRRARALRAGLRERLLAANGETPDPTPIAEAEAVLRTLPLTARLDPEDPLRGDDPLTPVARAWVITAATGEWLRLKQCPNHECGWVFWDATRSRTRRWCSMRVCGNRAKARAFAERRRTT
ncbi:CGNR zinc finger domain-containing protein [Thermoactinospora rubra]|uniref:CGNR zinc finger domain-containing protein n=1 Tax=Thermoactinospora rubra TaxID=1088767 RepID=UPI00197DA610|nr:CGNR zinc finger domain-containing protein [Thermoactinospora rubra]